MSIAQIKEEAKSLNEFERRDLVAYLIHLEQDKDTSYIDRITQKIDDKEKYVKWSDVRDEFTDD